MTERTCHDRNVIHYGLSTDSTGEVLDAVGSAFDLLASA